MNAQATKLLQSKISMDDVLFRKNLVKEVIYKTI